MPIRRCRWIDKYYPEFLRMTTGCWFRRMKEGKGASGRAKSVRTRPRHTHESGPCPVDSGEVQFLGALVPRAVVSGLVSSSAPVSHPSPPDLLPSATVAGEEGPLWLLLLLLLVIVIEILTGSESGFR